VMSGCWYSPHVAAPHTYCGSSVVCTTIAAIDGSMRCDRETSWGPRTVLCPRPDQRRTFASEVQARVRSSTRDPLTTIAVEGGVGGEVSSTRGRQEQDRDAHQQSTMPVLMQCRAFRSRFILWLSREASSASTPLRESLTKPCRLKAVCRLHLESTARAH
jgi:hypothetical protein